ncbi:MAG: hypothetical protein ACHWZW_07760 [Spirulina sp.]
MNRLVVIVVVVNLGLALGGLFLAWRLWWLKQVCATLAESLTTWERDLQASLALTNDLEVSRQQLLHLRQQYVILQRWLGYLPYLRQGLKLIVGLGFKGRQRLRRQGYRTAYPKPEKP